MRGCGGGQGAGVKVGVVLHYGSVLNVLHSISPTFEVILKSPPPLQQSHGFLFHGLIIRVDLCPCVA